LHFLFFSFSFPFFNFFLPHPDGCQPIAT